MEHKIELGEKMDLKTLGEHNAPKVDIIIASYGEVYWVKDLVASIERNTSDIDYRIIVVDNNPDDALTIPVKQFCESKGITCLLDRNITGYSDALNSGAALGTSDYIIYMDKDMLVDKDWLKTMLEVLESGDGEVIGGTKQDIGLVAPFLRYFDGRPLMEYTKYLMYFKQNVQSTYLPHSFEPLVDVIDVPEGEYAVGACYLVRRSLPIHWDRNFIRAYWEDTDFCKQVQHFGKKIVISLKAQVYHYVNTSHKMAIKEGAKVEDFSQMNRRYFKEKWEKIHANHPISL